MSIIYAVQALSSRIILPEADMFVYGFCVSAMSGSTFHIVIVSHYVPMEIYSVIFYRKHYTEIITFVRCSRSKNGCRERVGFVSYVSTSVNEVGPGSARTLPGEESIVY
jgi:hypothetical protein